MIRNIRLSLVAGLFVVACTPQDLDQAAGTVANIDLVKQCNELRLEKDRIVTLLHKLDDDELNRLEEINAVHRVICTADLRALTAEVQQMRRRAE